MSEYQYYEFCTINTPLTSEIRKEMYSLSSRAKVNTHGASYVYNHGNFRGNRKKLLLKYFDVFFYISNIGSIQLLFKYSNREVYANELKKYCINQVINCEARDPYIFLDINFNNEKGFGSLEGEGMLAELLPLYDEIKSGNYQFLRLVTEANTITTKTENSFGKNSSYTLSPAQKAFLKYAEVDQKIFDA